MALVFFDGMDDYGTGNSGSFTSIYSYSNTPPNAIIGGAFGGNGLGFSGITAGGVALRNITTPVSSFILGGRFLSTGLVNYFPCGLTFADASGNTLVTTQINFLSGISSVVVNGPLGTLGTAAYQTQLNVWFELEVLITVGTTTGSVIVKVNGVTILSLTNVNTQGSHGSTVGFGGFNIVEGSGYASGFVDDLYGCDTTGSAPFNTFLSTVAGAMGPAVTTLFPNSNSAVAMTPSTGTNYSNINGSSFQTGAYNSGTAAGQQDLYGLPLPSSVTGFPIGNILAVQTTFVGNENTAGTCSLSSTIESGGFTYQGTSHTMLASPYKYSDIWLVDPATSANWAPAKFNTAGQVFCGAKREV
jgi:hypothetical protein